MIKIHPEGKILARKVISFERILARIDSNVDGWHGTNKETMRRFVYDARLGKTIIGREKKKVGLKRLLKYLQDLKKVDHYFEKDFVSITEQDFERFILDLEEGRIKTPNGLPYALETQVVIKKMIKKFYKWLEGCVFALFKAVTCLVRKKNNHLFCSDKESSRSCKSV